MRNALKSQLIGGEKGDFDPATIGDLKRCQNELAGAVEKHLQDFQQAIVQTQQRGTMVWNLMNAVLRVLDEKGLASEAELVRAGMKLAEENQANMAAYAAAASQGAQGVAVKMTPIESVMAKPQPADVVREG